MVNNSQSEVIQFVECVFDSMDVVEVRRLPSKKSSWHTAQDLAAQADALAAENAAGENVYVGANPRSEHGGKDAEHTALARCLFADFDGVTVDNARQRIADAGLPTPTLLIDSGHGCHAWWRLTTPITNLVDWTAAQRRLIAVLSSDKSIHDAPRIMRLPGFLNVKQEPHVACRIIDADSQRRFSLASLLAVLPVAEMSKRSMPALPVSADDSTLALGSNAGNGNEIREGQRDSTLTSLAGSMRRRGMTQSEIETALHAVNSNRCKPPLPSPDVERIARSIARKPAAESAKAQVAAFQPFPVDVLPDPIGPYVTQAADAIGCDASFVALPLLAALAAAVGNTRRIQLKTTWFESCTLWAAVVGDSGTKKTPALTAGTVFLASEQHSAMAGYQSRMDGYLKAKDAYEDDLADWKRKGRKGERPEKPEEPIATRYIVSDTTIEALAVVLLHAPRGLLLERDELAGWINSFDQYKGGKGGDTAHWLTLYNAKPLRIDRKTGEQKTLYVPVASVSIAGGIQPGTLRRALGSEHWENGLAARLLLAFPPKRPSKWTNATVDHALHENVTSLFRRLLDLNFKVDSNDEPIGPYPTPIDLPLTPEAEAAFIAFYNRHGQEQMMLSGNEAALWSKLEGTAPRLALILQLVHDPASQAVDETSMAAGITLADWFGAEGRRVYALLANRGDDADAELSPELAKLLKYVHEKRGPITVRELTQGPQCYRGNADLAEADLQELVRAGYGEWQNVSASEHGGRPTRQFALTALGYGYDTPADSGDSDGSVAVAARGTAHTEAESMALAN